ncbi:MAG: glutamine amidotransferase-related protein, partial [Candidatus Rokuibacteriota bacterium]
PILGICAGHQFIGRHFGGEVAPGVTPEFGKMELTLADGADGTPLFQGVARVSTVWESHNDEVSRLPEGFRLLASSPSCKAQAMQHPDRPVFGLQFHPEVEHTRFGKRIFQNFVDVCKG